jgi:carnitine-CoA ligase
VLPQRIAELAQKHGNDTALVEVDGRSLTWGGVHDEAMRWAGALRSLGVRAGDTVATMLPNRLECFTVWIGVAWLRAIEVPANFMYKGHTLQYLLDQSDAEVIVISERYVDRLGPVARELPKLRTVVVPDATGPLPELPFDVVDGAALLSTAEPPTDVEPPHAWDIAAMIYTSGTTGPAKGVLVPWGELAQATPFTPDDFLGPGDVMYSVYPMFHLTGKSIFQTAGDACAKVVVRETFSVNEFWNDVRAHGANIGSLIGPIASMLLATPPAPDDGDNPLERVVMGPLVPGIDEFKTRFGVPLVTTGFGMTEIGFPIASLGNTPNAATCGRRRSGPPGYEVKIVDEHDHEVPIGEVGELVVRSYEPWAMNAGYWKMPDVTAHAWRNGWFHTGDAFREDEEGWLYFVDRMKDAVRRRGENISSFEVEAGIVRHPAVAEVAVVAVPSELGEGDILAAVVVLAGEELTPEALIEFLIPTMPRFMIPRYVEFVDSLPKTDATMRVRKIELRERGVVETTWDRETAGIVLPKD